MSKQSRPFLRQLSFEEGHPLYIHQESLNKIAVELNEETDRGAALFSASILDQALQNLLLEFLVDCPISRKMFKYPDPLSSFSARQNMCIALGLITEVEFEECNIIRSIRNKFAHASTYSLDFNSDDIVKLCAKFAARESLNKTYVDKLSINRMAFTIATQALLCRWAERLDFVSKSKRVSFYEQNDTPF